MDGNPPTPAPRRAPTTPQGQGTDFRFQRPKPSGDPARLTKEQAAYLLGHRRYAIWMWHEVFWSMPDFEGTGDGVPLAVEHLREARLALADEIHPNVFGELPRVLDDFVAMTRVLTEAWETSGEYRGFPFGSPHVPGEVHWRELLQLGDRALDRGSPLWRLDHFGVILGRYQLGVWRHEVATDSVDGYLGSLPDVRPLVDAARSLPAAVVDRVSWIQELIRLGSDLDRSGQASLLHALYRGQYGADPPDLMLDGVAVTRLFAALEEDTFGALAEVPPGQTLGDRARHVVGSDDVKIEEYYIVWDKKLHELRLNGRLIRRVKPGAKNIVPILDTFGELDWARLVDDPLSGDPADQAERLREAVRSLNEGLIRNGNEICAAASDRYQHPCSPRLQGAQISSPIRISGIRFSVTGLGKAIRWDPA